jgi:membrane protein YqaA with SNARE-associated domain
MTNLVKIVSVAITCSFAFKIGFPTAFVLLDHDFLKVITVTCAGGVAGNIFFTYLSSFIINAIEKLGPKKRPNHKKRKFTAYNKRVVKVKRKFGLAGIAFITPILLSTPIGAFLAGKFFKDKRKIILYFSAATFFWALTLYGFLALFLDSLHYWTN